MLVILMMSAAMVEAMKLKKVCSGSLAVVYRKFSEGSRPEESAWAILTKRCSDAAGPIETAARPKQTNNPVATRNKRVHDFRIKAAHANRNATEYVAMTPAG